MKRGMLSKFTTREKKQVYEPIGQKFHKAIINSNSNCTCQDWEQHYNLMGSTKHLGSVWDCVGK
jgi:hypothetical protein